MLLTNPSEDKQTCLEVLMKAFESEDLTARLSGGSPVKRRLAHIAKIEPALIDCQLWVARYKGEIGCVAAVAPPGKELWDTDEKKTYIDTAVCVIGDEARDRMDNELGPHQAHKSDIPGGARASYYIQSIGTHPRFQGRGLASAVLNQIEQRAKAAGVRMALVSLSETAVRVYKRCRFRSVYEAPLDFKDGTGVRQYHVMVNDCGLPVPEPDL
ncbi:hypothetical protein IAT38_001612 [Cryptococcus sp. DSM 104549]